MTKGATPPLPAGAKRMETVTARYSEFEQVIFTVQLVVS